MASCKDCLHVDVCKSKDIFGDMPVCPHFKDRNRFVELPCKVGDMVYFVIDEEIIKETITGFEIDKQGDLWVNTHKYDYLLRDNFGKTVFLTPEAAEKALNNPAKSDS